MMKRTYPLTLFDTLKGIFAGLMVLLTVNGLLSGCAAPARSGPSSKVEALPAMDQVTMMPLGDGGDGFILSEKVKLTAGLRRDFEEAVALIEKKDYEKAILLLDKVVEAGPGVTAPYVNIAIAYRKTGKPEAAEKHLKTALGLFPGHPVASNEYGLLLRKSGRFSEAKNVYEQALEQFPEFLPARRNLGILCDLYLNDPQCALAQFEQYNSIQPGDEQIELWISELRLRSEK